MMGTGPFAVPTFRALYESHHAVAALVSAPVRFHRGSKVAPVSPICDVAHEHNTPIFAPEDVNAPEALVRLAEFKADLMVVCDYGQILSAKVLASARLGGVNLHGSLLPKYRGAAPINWAIYHGETETGVTVIHMTPKVDAGPCIAQARTDIGPEETAVELEKRLAEMGAWLVRRAIDSVEAGRLEALPQNPALASKAPRLKKSDGAVDWSRPAVAIKSQVRAFQPWPTTYTFWHSTSHPLVRVLLDRVSAVESSAEGVTPGTVLEVSSGRLVVAAGEGAVSLEVVQPAGKRILPIDQFLRGYRVQPGDRLGPE